MKRILIIKTGASGDVLRTSVLLHLFKEDQITWITTAVNSRLLPQQMLNLKIVPIENIHLSEDLNDFDMTISLDDDFNCAELATKINTGQIIGAYSRDGKVLYSDSSKEWFDMGLISVYGKSKADELKKTNLFSYQEILFRMLGHQFSGEEYLIREDIVLSPKGKLIGIEARAGKRWPTKAWNQFDVLAEHLTKFGYEVHFFAQRILITDYLKDIAKCSLVVSGDSLAMHMALALKRPTIALFTCTSPTEIYSYDRLVKIISPKLYDAFYTNEYRPDVLNSIKVSEVLYHIKNILPTNQ
jgi:heptosyltransferase II